jgi:hypothetical protein
LEQRRAEREHDKDAVSMTETFDPACEPLRAIRDLINVCEAIFSADNAEQDIVERARTGFTTLRALFGDHRPAEDIAYAPMIEPVPVRELSSDAREALAFIIGKEGVAPVLAELARHREAEAGAERKPS